MAAKRTAEPLKRLYQVRFTQKHEDGTVVERFEGPFTHLASAKARRTLGLNEHKAGQLRGSMWYTFDLEVRVEQAEIDWEAVA